MIKAYRGLIPDGGQEKVRIKTQDGSRGYKIVKFQLVLPSPGGTTSEVVAKIWKLKQTTVDTLVDFNDQELLGVAVIAQSSDSWTTYDTVIFDQMRFNQDIFITVDDSQNNSGANYYLELEQVKLRDSENEYVTLRDLKQSLPQHGLNPPA